MPREGTGSYLFHNGHHVRASLLRGGPSPVRIVTYLAAHDEGHTAGSGAERAPLLVPSVTLSRPDEQEEIDRGAFERAFAAFA